MALRGPVASSSLGRAAARSRPRRWLLVAGFLLLALNLRPALTTVPPVLDEIQRDFGLPSSVAGLLTTVPVVCFAVLSLAAAALARRIGLENSLALFLVLVMAGSLMRGTGTPALFLGTALVGIGIAVANVLLPAAVKRYFPDRTGLMTGLYMMFMGIGASLAAATTVPIERLTSHGWPVVTAVWGALCAVTLAIWAPSCRARRERVVETANAVGIWRLARSPRAWQLTVFMGLQSLGYYSVLTWLPSLLIDTGLDAHHAGLLLGLANLCGIPASLTVPLIAHRMHSQSLLAVLAIFTAAAALLGLMIAPAAMTVLWVVVLGFSQGSAISLALLLIVLRSKSSEQAAQLSGMVQACGYALAAAGPFVVGALHDHSGGWVVPLGFLLVIFVVQAVAGFLAGRPGYVEVEERTTTRTSS